MQRSHLDQRKIVLAAATCAGAVIASQIAGKAARDAIFLSHFPVRNLPLLLAISAALSIATTFAFVRTLSRGVPARVVQLANAASAFALLVEWLALPHLPRPIATLIYMHQTLVGPILVSGFWSIVSECFDPRTARRVVGTIGTAATLGGLAGAVIAERVAAIAGTAALLPTIAGLQLLAAWRLRRLAACGTAALRLDEVEDEELGTGEVVDVAVRIARVSLLRRLATITVVVTVVAALLDYVFKASVTEQVHDRDLARVFATFHGVVGLATALAAWFGRAALRSWGLARTLAILPGAVIGFGALALIAPGFGSFAVLRGTENVVRNSLYREAYEVFYTPLMASDRRATKTVIDVGVERFGDLLGGLAVLVILALAPFATPALVVVAIGLSMIGVAVALQAQRSYVAALEQSLIARAIELELDEPADRTTKSTLEVVAHRPPREPAPEIDHERIGHLRSRDPSKVRAALELPLGPAALAYAIPLLARDDVGPAASRAIAAVARRLPGQLIDAAHDLRLPARVRAQLPALIATAGGELARAGLMACLRDPDLEVRFRAAQALLELRDREPGLELDDGAVFEGVRRELAVEPATWRALDAAPSDGPISRAAQHLATLLALALPAEPVRTAVHGLWSDDPAFRGVALEYLDNVLPGDIRDRMWHVLAIEAPAAAARRPVEDVRAELLRTLEREQLAVRPASSSY